MLIDIHNRQHRKIIESSIGFDDNYNKELFMF